MTALRMQKKNRTQKQQKYMKRKFNKNTLYLREKTMEKKTGKNKH